HLLGRMGDDSPDEGDLSKMIAELRGWTLQDYQREEPFCNYVAHDARFGVAVERAAFEQWRARRRQKEQEHAPAPKPSGAKEESRKRRGPEPGALRRYEASDMKLIPELEQIMAALNISKSAAALRLAEAGKIEGAGTPKSRAKRLVAVYSEQKTKSA